MLYLGNDDRTERDHHDRDHDRDRGQPAETPLADALLRVTGTGVGNLHALPASQGRSLRHSTFRDKYLRLFGSDYLDSDVSFSTPALDSFFRPRTCLARAQQLAAQAFGADSTLFITCGTTVANNVALAAMGVRGRRLLVDRTCHQSIHFALDRMGADVTYAGYRPEATSQGLSVGDTDDLVRRFSTAAQAGEAYDAVVLSGSSYDGTLLKMPTVLDALLDHVDELDVLVDEAWSALHNFHSGLRAHTALAAARHVRERRPGKAVRMFVTQSAHKSMSALRQASFLHIVADDAARHRAEEALYATHTTSPSLPILASLDLARAQASVEGEEMVERCLEHARRLRDVVASDALPGLTLITPAVSARWALPDPTKVVVDFGGAGMTGSEARTRLFHDYGLYTARGTARALLFNMHAGVTADVLARLENALRDIAATAPAVRHDPQLTNAFVIPYPPGIPVSVPGELSATDLADQLAGFAKSGVEVFSVTAHTPAAN